MKGLAQLLPLVLILAVFWLLLIRPAQRRNRDLATLQRSVGVGDRVMLSSGFYGTVRAIDDDLVRIELADGVVAEVARAAIHRVVDPADEPAFDEPAFDEPVADEPVVEESSDEGTSSAEDR
ncbi:MAG: preprotein translocase subunit YajC [Nocardioides sp.]|uniref:preprotein translocase subunit YajC n=1 Tax=Nocardioides sp. TaxID=35761 RepID=UPI0039E27765